MHPTSTLATSASPLIAYGYPLMFVLMIVEGPVVTAAGAFVAALGFFNIWTVFLLSILGNIIPDILYYAIGYYGREAFAEKYGKYFGLTPKRLRILEGMAENHSGKWLITVKLVSILATPGLIVAGITRMDIKKFTWWCLAIILPSSGFYLILGYYFGAAYGTFDHYLHIGGYIIAGIVVIFIALAYFQQKITGKIFGKDFFKAK